MKPASSRPHFFDLVVGEPGRGKTSLLLSQCNRYQAAGWQVIYTSIADDRIPSHPGVIVAVDFAEAWSKVFGHPAVLLAVDELESVVPSSVDEEDDKKTVQMVRRIVRLRRHVGISLIGASHDPWDIRVGVRKLFSRIMYFEMDSVGEKWLRGMKVPEESLRPPKGCYNVYDKNTRGVSSFAFARMDSDWKTE